VIKVNEVVTLEREFIFLLF